MLQFAYPWLLIIIAAPPVLFHFLPAYKEFRYAVNVPFLARLVRITGQQPEEGAVILRGSVWQKLVLWCCWVLLVVALAQPQWIEDPIVKTLPTRDLLLAVDLSGSMETEDFTDQSGQHIDRLSMVKRVLDDFLSRREGDRVGLLFFGTAPFIQAPFTEDLEICRTLLHEAEVRMAGSQTMIGDAIGLAINVFEQSETREKTLILLTDGNDTGSKVPPLYAAKIAHDKGVTIHTVVIGDPQTVGENELDEQSLREIASITGGDYFRALDRVGLEEIYRRLDKIETHQVDTLSFSPKKNLFYWPLAGCFLLVIGFHLVKIILLRNRKKLKGGWSAAVIILSALIALMVTVLLCFDFPGTFHFLRPMWLIPLILVPILVGQIRFLQTEGESSWCRVIAPHLRQHLVVGRCHSRRLRPRHLLAVILLLASVALAGPSWRYEPSPLTEDQTALFLVVKVTPSMQLRDLQPSRLQRAEQKIHDLLALRVQRLNGLIVYAGSAHLVMPLTRDGSIIGQFADELSPEIMPVLGDVAHDALVMAGDRLTVNGGKGAILLITDGIDPDEMRRIAEIREKISYPINILGMVYNSRTHVADNFDQPGLEALARQFDGSLVMATPDSEDINYLADRIKTAMVDTPDSSTGESWQDAGYWLLFPLVLFSLFWFRAGWVVIYG